MKHALPLALGSYVWVTQVATPTAVGAAAQAVSTAPVQIFTAMTGSVGTPHFAKLVSGNKVVTIIPGAPNDSISVWSFDSGATVKNGVSCKTFFDDGGANPDGVASGVPLQIVTPASNTAASTISNSTSIPAALGIGQPTDITLDLPLVAGQIMCLVETNKGISLYSKSAVVTDPDDLGLFRPYFVLGIQATNQLSTAGNSSAAQYLEVGFNSFYTPGSFSTLSKKKFFVPPFATNVDIRLSPIPVAGSSQTTSSVTTSINSIQPNQLSSQQSVRLVTSAYLPFKLRSFKPTPLKTDYFTFAPLGRAAFGTLLNSSVTSTSGVSAVESGTVPTQVTTTSFAPGFDVWGLGARFGVDRYYSDSDEAPQVISQFLVTLGDNSNLPSYVCKLAPLAEVNPYATGPAVSTACNQGQYAPSYTAPATTGPGWTYYTFSRTLRPRLDIEGIVKMPSYPFILGIDMNLQQYGIFSKNNLDFLNKPGNDVRVYVGIAVDFKTLVSKL